MAKKYILKYAAYAAIFSLFTLAEKAIGLYGISTAFLFSLLFCREKFFITLPCYLLCETLIPFSVQGLVFCGGGAAVYSLAYLIHGKRKLRCGFAEAALLTLLSLTPYIVLNILKSYENLPRILLSTTVALALGYAGILAAYPVLIRGLRYKPTSGEIFCMGVLIGVAGAGLGLLNPFGIKLCYFAVAFFLMFLRGTSVYSVLPFGIACAVGLSLGRGEAAPVCTVAVAALVIFGCPDANSFLCAFIASMVFTISYMFFKFDIFAVAPFAFGAFAAACIPKKAFEKVAFSRKGYVGRYAMRTVVNRDREDISSRIKNISEAFYEMKNILCLETEGEPNISAVTESVCKKVCGNCFFCGRCIERLDLKREINKLVAVADKNGKAGLLDVSSLLGENCRKLNYVIMSVNEGAANYRKIMEARKGAELGREMIIAQTGGIAELLDEMARSVRKGLSFDVDREKKLTERLLQANIVASDVMLYEDETGEEATVVVREKDAGKAALSAIVSDALGKKMTVYGKKAEVGGTVGVSFCRAPDFKIMYGESVYAKEERCGDTRRAIKIGKNKVMFILSDGMGTGKNAQMTAGNVICLLETFYKAGFDHRTIFSSVAGMLSLRTKEDFSALDVAVIDLATGKTDFIKQGGRESFILSERGCETIEGGTLPMGIIADSQPRIERRELADDETVILMSDGVADALDAEEIKAAAFSAGISNPKTVADEIVELAKRKNGNSTDDMTVMAMRLIRLSPMNGE